MVTGTFVEAAADPHVSLRQELLESGQPLGAPGPLRHTDAESLLAQMRGPWGLSLQARGLLCVQLEAPLSSVELARLGQELGNPLPETDPAVQPYVDSDIILNLVSEHANTDDVALQPFATNALTLHSESSGRPASEQPRYIVLMCREPGLDIGTQTVLVPMAEVERQLTPRDLHTLSETRYQSAHDVPPIVRRLGDRYVFSFRDFFGQALRWTCPCEGETEASVNASLRRLLAAMYAPRAALGVRWSRALLVIMDNTFFFHGRTRALESASGPRRHLQRLRILSRSAESPP
jgi:hypothetical protein